MGTFAIYKPLCYIATLLPELLEVMLESCGVPQIYALGDFNLLCLGQADEGVYKFLASMVIIDFSQVIHNSTGIVATEWTLVSFSEKWQCDLRKEFSVIVRLCPADFEILICYLLLQESWTHSISLSSVTDRSKWFSKGTGDNT